MDALDVCTIAVGLPDGPRSSSFGVALADDRTEIRLSARTPASRCEMAIRPPPGSSAAPGESAPLTRPGVREAVFEGAWIAEGRLAVAWPGREIAPGTWRQLSLYVSGSALRKFGPPAGEPEPRWIASPGGLGQVVVSFLVAAGAGTPEAVAGADEQLLGQGALADGRTLWVSARREAFISPLQKAGLFTALRKRPPPDISQAAAWRDGTRVLFACALDGVGLVVEQPGDLFRTRANY